MIHSRINIVVLSFLIVQFTGICAQEIGPSKEGPRLKLLFDDGWKFYRGAYEGAHKVDLDDSNWRDVALPHDWSIEDRPGSSSPFDIDAVGQTNTGFTKGGTSWYRKSFVVNESSKELKVHLQFDGVYMNSEVWLNGKKLGEHPYGYTSFWFDISEGLKYGGENIIAVKVKNEGKNSRWYSGSGIYRHVWLSFMDAVHVAHWGTLISTSNVNERSADVHINNRIKNETNRATEVLVQTTLINEEGEEVAKSESKKVIKGAGSENVFQEIVVESPKLWSVANPHLYMVRTLVFVNDLLKDELETRIGIRSIKFDAEVGFQLNGKKLELKGGNVHHDNGPLGAKAYDRAEERKVELLKANGYNAIRSAHNPPSPAFLDACDRLGMLVINEAFDMWRIGKNPHDYHLYFDEFWQKDISSMVNRDFNHPSVIMWSVGNEIPEMHRPEIVKTARELADYVRELDSTRPVTAAVNNLGRDKDNFFKTLDVAGYNYGVGGDHGKPDVYAEDHQRVPERIMYGAETYPLHSFDSWMAAKEKPWVIGDFVWTSFDYIGEASIGWLGYPMSHDFYPWTLAYCGDLDICGWKRPQSFYRDAFWGEEPALSLFIKRPEPSFEENPERAPWSKWHFPDLVSSWTWNGYNGENLDVVVYSSYDKVEILLNGRSLGAKMTNVETENKVLWEVPYEEGKLEAIGYIEGEIKAKVSLYTAQKPAKLKLSADRTEIRANGQDLSYVTVEVQDSEGNLNPNADNSIQFEIEGPGTIIGVGNANPISTESFTKPQRKAWRGKCLIIVKAGKDSGTIRLKAKSNDLSTETIKIRTSR